MKNVNPVCWFEIYVDNLQRAKKFYEQVFDLEMQDLPFPASTEMQMLAFPMNMESKNTASGALVKMDGMKAGGNSTIVYFEREDCSIEESRVVSAGGKILTSKESLGEYGFMVLISDTEGNTVGIHSLK
ncbi:VOC family protein [Pedobacter arcticus]|uniref:VOC family protein n=1 Tax=Pedobacter arcticus TaxID=752140 RepID=UPI0002EB8F65|nr:VOC family protein [Pedobacter arcticus]